MNFVSKTRNRVSKMMNFALKMLSFAVLTPPHQDKWFWSIIDADEAAAVEEEEAAAGLGVGRGRRRLSLQDTINEQVYAFNRQVEGLLVGAGVGESDGNRRRLQGPRRPPPPPPPAEGSAAPVLTASVLPRRPTDSDQTLRLMSQWDGPAGSGASCMMDNTLEVRGGITDNLLRAACCFQMESDCQIVRLSAQLARNNVLTRNHLMVAGDDVRNQSAALHR